jgi:DNA-binding NtrC family response regulator
MSGTTNVALVGDSVPMQRLREMIYTIAPTRLPVLIEGATGTGKELIAALVHRHSTRRGAFVAFNVCALGESMFEDSLFGHVRGAYTGAVTDSMGFLREADGGSAFFDEISGLPVTLQAKLLRAVETGVFRPIGAARDVSSDFRVVAATNEHLGDLVDRGRFRADLRHRLSGVVISVPSLADRVDDIPDLARHFAQRATGAYVTVDDAALDLLMDTAWPGNVRELKQVVDVAAAFSRGVVDVESVRAALSHRNERAMQVHESVIDDRRERRELVTALQTMSWDVDRAAEHLGIHRATIYRRMKRHGIEVARVAPSRATMRQDGATNATSVMQ